MRGEHCVIGATVLSAISVILLIFVNIGQISSGAVTRDIYMVQVNTAAYGNALVTAKNVTVAGLYDTSTTDALGTGKGLRQTYRYGLYGACGYQKTSGGKCNTTMVTYPYEPLSQILADTPTKYATWTSEIIPSSKFKSNGYNHAFSKAASGCILVGSVLSFLAMITGWYSRRLVFLVASSFACLSAVLLMIGAAIWTAIISGSAALNSVKVQHGASLGINVTAGAGLYLTWTSFVLTALSCIPYVISFATYQK